MGSKEHQADGEPRPHGREARRRPDAIKTDSAWLSQRLDNLSKHLDALRRAGSDRRERDRILAEMQALADEMETLIHEQRRAIIAER